MSAEIPLCTGRIPFSPFYEWSMRGTPVSFIDPIQQSPGGFAAEHDDALRLNSGGVWLFNLRSDSDLEFRLVVGGRDLAGGVGQLTEIFHANESDLLRLVPIGESPDMTGVMQVVFLGNDLLGVRSLIDRMFASGGV